MEWITENWPWIFVVLTLLISVLNSITEHYGEGSTKLKRGLMFVVDVLSILTSKGGALKMPGTTSPSLEVKK